MAKHTIRFWLRVDKPNKGGTQRQAAGTVPLHLVISVEGERQYYNTGISLYPEQWDDENKKITALSPKFAKKHGLRQIDLPEITKQADEDNVALSTLQKQIKDITDRFKLDGVRYSSKMIKEALSHKIKPDTKKEEKVNELHQFMARYIRENEATRKEGSLQVYRAVKKRIEGYEKYKSREVTFDNIDYAFFESFKSYLHSVCGLNSTTVAKQLSTVKTFLNYAIKYGYQVSNKYKTFKIQRDPLEVIALTQFEFDKLWELDLFGKPRLDSIRDVFIFSCCTGMRFSDLDQLNRDQIKRDAMGNRYIEQTVQKTKAKLKIPLNRIARQILAKYEDYPRPLPIVSNQKSNEALHDLCEEAEINEPIEIVRFQGAKRIVSVHPKHELITMHTGRKTFCTLSLEKGMSAETVMSISGHKDYKSFKRYVNITDDNASTAMRLAWD